MPHTLIDLMRHGEPVGGRRYRGHGIDDPLSEKGWQQMWRAVPENPPWQAVISSPLLRCREFAEALAAKHRLPLHIEPRLREVGFGKWEGKTPEDIQRQWPQDYQAFYRDPVGSRPAAAEPLDEFAARVGSAFGDILNRHRGQHVLIVAHAGVNRALITHCLGVPAAAMYRIQVANAGLSRIRHDSHGLSLLFHNLPRLA